MTLFGRPQMTWMLLGDGAACKSSVDTTAGLSAAHSFNIFGHQGREMTQFYLVKFIEHY